MARECPGYWDNIVLIDSTPVETARSRETVKRAGDSSLDDAIANAAAYGYCASHSRWFYGMRLHGVFGPDGTPRAAMLVGADRPERDIALTMLPAALRGGELVIGDKGYAGREFADHVAQLGGTLSRHFADEGELVLLACGVAALRRAGDVADPDSPGELAYDRVPMHALNSQRALWRGVRRRAREVTCPVLLLRSAVDHVVPARSSASILRRISSTDIREVVLENSFHVVPLDHDAPRLHEESVAFARRVTGDQ